MHVIMGTSSIGYMRLFSGQMTSVIGDWQFANVNEVAIETIRFSMCGTPDTMKERLPHIGGTIAPFHPLVF